MHKPIVKDGSLYNMFEIRHNLCSRILTQDMDYGYDTVAVTPLYMDFAGSQIYF